MKLVSDDGNGGLVNRLRGPATGDMLFSPKCSQFC